MVHDPAAAGACCVDCPALLQVALVVLLQPAAIVFLPV